MTTPPEFDERTCLYEAYGYQLYAWEGKPWIVHRFKQRLLNKEKGVKESFDRLEQFDLESEGWGGTTTARIVQQQARDAWTDHVTWNELHGRPVKP